MILISIVTCTYNRPQFLRNLCKLVISQNFPHTKIEWVIIDDSTERDSLPEVLDGITVRYHYLPEKTSLAEKRDIANSLAQGRIFVIMDDDDYYPPTRLSHAFRMLTASRIGLAGTSLMFMYFTIDRQIYRLGPYSPNHGTACTLAYTCDYAREHKFYNGGDGLYAEEAVFTNQFTELMIQLDPFETVLALQHSDNTVDKVLLIDKEYIALGRSVHPTSFTLATFIDDPDIQLFYNQLEYSAKREKIPLNIQKMPTIGVQPPMTPCPPGLYCKEPNENYIFNNYICQDHVEKEPHENIVYSNTQTP